VAVAPLAGNQQNVRGGLVGQKNQWHKVFFRTHHNDCLLSYGAAAAHPAGPGMVAEQGWRNGTMARCGPSSIPPAQGTRQAQGKTAG